MDELLRVESLCAGYGQRRVLRDVSFSVRRGELCALLGANGSGKSTLLRALCGLTDASGGCMLLEADLWDMPARRRARLIGYLAQRSACELALSALDVVLMGCNPELGTFQRPGAQHRQRALALLAELAKTRQILFLTCRSREAEAAKRYGASEVTPVQVNE